MLSCFLIWLDFLLVYCFVPLYWKGLARSDWGFLYISPVILSVAKNLVRLTVILNECEGSRTHHTVILSTAKNLVHLTVILNECEGSRTHHTVILSTAKNLVHLTVILNECEGSRKYNTPGFFGRFTSSEWQTYTNSPFWA